MPHRDTLYYDGQCPLCRREIALLGRLKDHALVLQDLCRLEAPGPADPWPRPDADQLMRSLHLRTAAGAWLTGIDATVRAWSHTPIGWLWTPLRWPLLKPLAERCYRRWAARRYRRRMQCSAAGAGRCGP